MARWTYDGCYTRLLSHEGGYTNDPHDPGGPTNFGVTIFDARKYAAEFGWIVGRAVTAQDVRNMPTWFAAKVFRAKYWDAVSCDLLPAGVDDSVDDYGVNSGIGRSGKVLRRVLGLDASSYVVTDSVISALGKRDPNAVIDAIAEERLRFLKSLSTWPHFGPGWGRRVAEVHAYSRDLQAHAALHGADSVVVAPPAPTVAPAPGKGHVPAPTGTKTIIKSTAGGAVMGVPSFAQWIAAHPIESELSLVGGALVIGGALYAVNHWHRAKQEAPTPGLVPVPAIAA